MGRSDRGANGGGSAVPCSGCSRRSTAPAPPDRGLNVLRQGLSRSRSRVELDAGLPEAHSVAFGVLEVGEPADVWDLRAQRDHAAAAGLDLLQRLVDGVD